jgi:hypothetical protein
MIRLSHLPHFLTATALLIGLFSLVSCDLLLSSDREANVVDPQPVCHELGHGDVNCNGLGYEIADAVMFTNYFIYGDAAFGSHIAGSKAATNVNGDCFQAMVADLVYLIRVVIGDATPYTKPGPVAANVTYGADRFNVNVEMGAAYIVMEGNVVPTLLAGNMEMKYRTDGETTRILVYSLELNQSFSGDFLQVAGNVVSTEFASFTGARVATRVIPSTFVVEQNYPNPFNPTTKIRFTVPNGGPWSLSICDIHGALCTGTPALAQPASRISPGTPRTSVPGHISIR